MKKLFLLLSALIVLCMPAVASCDDETISDVKGDGEIIILLDGSVWKSLDPATSSTWLSGEDVQMCNDDQMINVDEDGDSVDVVRIR
jgi:hypothetical protein